MDFKGKINTFMTQKSSFKIITTVVTNFSGGRIIHNKMEENSDFIYAREMVS